MIASLIATCFHSIACVQLHQPENPAAVHFNYYICTRQWRILQPSPFADALTVLDEKCVSEGQTFNGLVPCAFLGAPACVFAGSGCWTTSSAQSCFWDPEHLEQISGGRGRKSKKRPWCALHIISVEALHAH